MSESLHRDDFSDVCNEIEKKIRRRYVLYICRLEIHHFAKGKKKENGNRFIFIFAIVNGESLIRRTIYIPTLCAILFTVS